MDWLRILAYMWENHRGKIIGCVLGLIFGICIVAGGFLAAVIIIICLLVGFYIGKKVDEKTDFKKVVTKIFNNKDD